MAINQMIAQGLAPIGRDLPEVGNMLQQMQQNKVRNALAERGMEVDYANAETSRLNAGTNAARLQADMDEQDRTQVGTALDIMESVTDPAQFSKLADAYSRHPLAAKLGITRADLEPGSLMTTRARLGVAPPKPEDIGPLEQYVGEDGNPVFGTRAEARGKTPYNRPAPSTTVTVNNKQEGAEAVEVGKSFGEIFVNLQKADMAATGKLSRLDRMEQLVGDVETGRLTPIGVEFAQAAKTFGWNIDPKLSNKEAAIALASEMTLELRNPSGGAGMPGAMSDRDLSFLQQMSPDLAKTKEGRKLIIETSRALAKRDKEVAAMARTYRKKAGSLDAGFYDELAKFSAANPLFKSKAPSELTDEELIKRLNGG